MNRTEFMERLEELLSDVPQEERRDALRYYNDYLDDAGAENENAALAALVSPENVADSIRAGLQEEEASGSGRNAVGRPVSGQERNAAGRQATGPERPGRKGEAGRIILTVLACIFLLPVLIPLGLGAVILAFSFLVCAAVFFASMILSGIVVLVIGVALSLFALVNLAAFPSSAVCILGGGMVCVGIGLLLTLFMCWLAGKTIPAMFRGFVSLCSLPFHRNKGGRQEERPLS